MTKQALAGAKQKLHNVEMGIEALKSRFEDCNTKKKELADNVETCSARLDRAEKVIGSQ